MPHIGTRLRSCSWLCPAGKQDSLSAVDLTTERLVAEVLHSAHTAAAASSSSGAAYTPLQRTLGSGGSAALGREAASVSGLVSPGRGTLPRGGCPAPSSCPQQHTCWRLLLHLLLRATTCTLGWLPGNSQQRAPGNMCLSVPP